MSSDALSSRIKAIDEKLACLTPFNAEERCIFKVHEQLRKVNEKAYEPMLLAIGPYNDHGKVGQGLMEEHKLRYLKQMLERKNESSVEAYIRTLRGLEERARNCYAEWINLTTGEFLEMILLDGCFIIELFRKSEKFYPRNEHDAIFQISWMLPQLARDLLLCENQLPFFVLTELLMMIESSTQLPNRSEHLGEQTINIEQNNEIACLESSISIDQRFRIRLGNLAISFFSRSSPFRDHWDVKSLSSYSSDKPLRLCQTHKAITPPLAKMVREHLHVGDKFKNADFKHLLDLIHTMIKLPVLDMELDRAIERQVGVKFKIREIFKHFAGLIRSVTSVPGEMENVNDRTKSIPNATELRECGVNFKKAEQRAKLAVQFSNGTLEISPLRIEDETETLFRNLIAYEQYSPCSNLNYVTDYVRFMDDLIDSPKDVELLRRKGILENWLGDDEVASTMVNKLGRHVTISTSSLYAKTSIDVNKHCDKPWNKWKAKLRHNYFHSPWALLSVLVAILVLGLAITQTVFSIID